MNVMRLFVQISPLMLTVLIASSMAYANPQGSRVTEEDSARIEALKMEPAKEALVRGFVHEIRSKAEAAGLEPTDFLPPMPSGEKDQDYSAYRLKQMQIKREAANARVRAWAAKNGVKPEAGAVSSRKISRNEAMARASAVFEPDPYKQGELYSKLIRTPAVQGKAVKVDMRNGGSPVILGENGRRILAQVENLNSSEAVEDYELTTVGEIFGVKKKVVKKKKSKQKIMAQRRAEAELERKNQREQQRLLKRQKQIATREAARQKREALIAEREAKKAKLREKKYATPYSDGTFEENDKSSAPEKQVKDSRSDGNSRTGTSRPVTDATASSNVNPENKLYVSPEELVSKDEDATLKVKEVFRKTETKEIKRGEIWDPGVIYESKDKSAGKPLTVEDPAPGKKTSRRDEMLDWRKSSRLASLATESDSPVVLFGRNDKPKTYRSVLLSFFGSIVNSAHAAPGESSIQENRVKFSPEDLNIFKEQAKKLESKRKPDNEDSDALEKLGIELKAQKDAILSSPETMQKAGSVVKESQTLFKDLENEQSLAPGTKEQSAANPETETKWLTTFFISESMGKEKVKALIDAYAGDNTVRFVLKGFNGKGTINDGLKWLLDLILGMNPQPNILLDPELFQRYDVTVAPTMLLERVDGVPVEKQSADEQKISRTLKNLGTALGLAEDQSKTAADQIAQEVVTKKALTRRPALIVSGVTSREWAIEKAKEGAEFNQKTQGEVFEISERDILEIAKERVARIDWERKKEEALNRFWERQQDHYVSLPLAQESTERIVDPSIVLNRDVYGADGSVVFKAGQKFNPFDRMPFTKTVIVFNASIPKEVEAVAKLVKEEQSQNRNVLLLVTEFKSSGAFEQIKSMNESWREPVYLLTPELKERFQIRATPTVVRADNKKKVFKVEEISLLSEKIVNGK